jgi:hypothetical protein
MARGIFGRGRPASSAQRTRMVWLAAGLIGCGGVNSGSSAPNWRANQPTGERTTGCIDTPFIAPDSGSGSATSGIQCGREPTPSAQLVRGRVVSATASGLPGPSLAGVWVSVHLVRGALEAGTLPPVHAEVVTNPQGEFVISVAGAAEVVLGVRTSVDGSVFPARRLAAADERREIVLIVPDQN